MTIRSDIAFRICLATASIAANPFSLEASDDRANTEWHHYGQDPGGRRYSDLDLINAENVSGLKRAWTAQTGDIAPPGAHYFECTPLVVDGTMYVITTFSRLLALDATTGERLWEFNPEPPLGLHETGAGGLASRGVAYWESGDKKRIFLPVRDGRLYSIDVATRKPDPAFGQNGCIDLRAGLPHDGRYLFLSSPPALHENVLLQPIGINDEPSAPARAVPLRAFDAHTGELLWSFNTVPQNGEFGSDTWQGDSNVGRGGCNAWAPISVDRERGIFYVPTGAPNNDKYGGDRVGDNLFANCILALDARSGERLWHFQTVHHDLWDYDMPAMPNVVDLTLNGQSVPCVSVVGKTGFVYLFNRLTGEPIFPIEERAVPQSDIPGEQASPTQPFPTKPPPFSRQTLSPDSLVAIDPESRQSLRQELSQYRNEGLFTPPSRKGTVVYPGQLGGANWSGAAVDAEGCLYVTASELPYVSALEETDENPFGWNPKIGHFRDKHGYPAAEPPWGTLTKFDLNQGELLWQRPLGEIEELRSLGIRNSGTLNFGGATTTAGGLILVAATIDERFRVFDSQSGALLFEMQLPAAGNGAPVTYLGRDGRQYIALCAGGGGKSGTPAGDYVVAFALPNAD